MARLIAQTPCAGLLPRQIGHVSLTEVAIECAWLVAPLRGGEPALAEKIGLPLPKPNRVTNGPGARAIWMGPGQALVIAPTLPDVSGCAAVTDQSDAFACVAVSGANCADLLARLVPIDLRPSKFKTGHTARTLVGHMAASVTRTSPDTIEVMVMRSMAETLVHELTQAATLLVGRG